MAIYTIPVFTNPQSIVSYAQMLKMTLVRCYLLKWVYTYWLIEILYVLGWLLKHFLGNQSHQWAQVNGLCVYQVLQKTLKKPCQSRTKDSFWEQTANHSKRQLVIPIKNLNVVRKKKKKENFGFIGKF